MKNATTQGLGGGGAGKVQIIFLLFPQFANVLWFTISRCFMDMGRSTYRGQQQNKQVYSCRENEEKT